jgi:Ca2+-binding RTX toxin-like protein
VSGSGDTDNSAFSIKGDKLKISASPDYETQSSYSIRLKTTDFSGGLSYEAPFTVSVNNLDEELNTTIIGTKGKDTLQGSEYDDYIDGKKGNDIIYGSNGDDTIIGGKGRDMIYTGEGSDMITMSKKLGKGRSWDYIWDFTKGEDYLLIKDKQKNKYQFVNEKESGALALFYKNDGIGVFNDLESNDFEWTKAENGKSWYVEIF